MTEHRSYPTRGNAFRINDQSKTRYPLTLMIHDREHLELVKRAEKIFSGRYPLGYVGTSPWLGTMTNQEGMDYADSQNIRLYDFLRDQMEIGWIIYGLRDSQEKSDIAAMIKDMREKCPEAEQFWMRRRGEELSVSMTEILEENDICITEYEDMEEAGRWLERLGSEIEKVQPPSRVDALEREWAEWTNLSITLPEEETDNRVLLVGDSISVGYGDMVQQLMPEWHVDRLNTSEGIHHPNFMRLLEIALERYPYRIVHINNGIHLHGQTVEQYGRNLLGVFDGIHQISPGTKIIFAATTPLSRTLSGNELEGYQAQHFSMGDRVPIAQDARREDYWVIDEKASEIYRQLNERAGIICAEQGIPLNDLYQLCVDENLQKSDGVHFQEDAYRRLANKVAEALGREL